MHLLGIILRLVIFFCSCMGYWEFFRRKTRVNIYFLPVLTVAVQAFMLFMAGLLNILSVISFLMVFAGIAALICFIVSDRGISWVKHYGKTGYVYFGVMLVAILLSVNGKVVSHFDNFSHWALVVRQMLLTDRFPNFQDNIIAFQEYPLGSAAFIYYVAKIVGHAESVWMFAQGYMITACILPVFMYCRKNRVLSFVFMCLTTNLIFVYNIKITELLVDTLLPLAAMSMLLFTYYAGKNKDTCGELYLTIPFSIWILQIKNAGIYFCVIATLWILSRIKSRKGKLRKGEAVKTALTAFAPYVSLLLWQKHCDYVFLKADTSNHAMTAQNYMTELSEKSLNDIWTICSSWIKFCLTYKEVWLVFFCFAVVGVVYYFICRNSRKQFYLAAIFAIVLYITYQIGTMAMYVFSMPLNEALVLAGSTRYCKSILLAVFFVILILCMKILSRLNRVNVKNAISCFALVASVIVIWGFTDNSFQLFFNIPGDNCPEERKWIESNANRYNIPEGAKCCILAPEDNRGYLRYICRYVLHSPQIKAETVSSQEDLEGVTDWDYVFIYDNENPIIQDWIQEYYPDQLNQNVIVKGE